MFTARLFDKIRLVQKTGQVQATDFVEPDMQGLASRLLAQYPEINWEMDGGNEQAERKRVVLTSIHNDQGFFDNQVVLLKCKGNCPQKEYEAARISHRDFLGAVLGTGIKREKIGDIWLNENGCILAVAQEIAGYIMQQVLIVRGINMEVNKLEQDCFSLPEKEGKKIETTVSSLRLDALAACGFGTSRSKMAKEIAAGKLKVNWQETDRSNLILAQGDLISCRGRGRVIIDLVEGQTRKGRYKVILSRLI